MSPDELGKLDGMHLRITLKNYRCFSDSEPATFEIRPGITSFVGINNSGKSSLLRFFYEFRQLFRQAAEFQFFHQAFHGQNQEFSFPASILDVNELFSNGNTRNLRIDLDFLLVPESLQGQPPAPTRVSFLIPRGGNRWTAEVFLGEKIATNDVGVFGTHLARTQQGGHGNIPIVDLRAVQVACNLLANTIYLGPFRNAINFGSNDSYFDMQVGQGFIQSWKNFKTGYVKSNNERILNLTQEIRNIFGYESLEINASPDDKTLQILANGRSFKLNEVGSGMTQFILVLATAAIRAPALIFIDEPELGLHPSLQLDFLTSVASYASFGVVFATHSVGLAKAASERIYSVQMQPDKSSRVRNFDGDSRFSELVGEMGYNAYRDLGFTKVLLVEGTTEIKTIQQFLRLYKKEHQVVLLPLGGGALIKADIDVELQELKRISNDIFVLIDSEKSHETDPLSGDRGAFVAACGRAAVAVKVLDRRATENYLTDAAVKLVKGEKYSALEPYEALKQATIPWAKSENWRIARQMSASDIDGTDLGQFLKTL